MIAVIASVLLSPSSEPELISLPSPVVDEKLLVADAVEAVIQINGKIKERIEVPPTITDAEIEALALAHPTIAAELNGATPKKVIARAPKIVKSVL